MSPHRVERARFAVMAAFLVCGLGMGLWAGHIAWLQASLDIDHKALSLVLLGVALGAIVAMSTAGWLVARFGSRACTIASAAAFAIALVLPYQAGSYLLLVLAAMPFGMAMGILDVAMNAHGAAVEKARGRPAMSSFHAFFSLGGMLGGIAAAAMLKREWSPDFSMPLMALLLLAVTAAFSTSLMRDASGEGGEAGFVMPSRAVLFLGLLTALGMAGEGALLDWLAVYMNRELFTGLDVAALGFSVFAGAMMVCRFTGDAIVRRFGAAAILRASAALAALGLLFVVVAPSAPTALVGAALVGLGIANVVPILFSASAAIPGLAPSQALAMVAMLGYGGFLLGPPILGALGDAFGLRASFAFVLLGMLAIAGLGGRALGQSAGGAAVRPEA